MSFVKLKPIAEQVVVITGASSGHGLAAARKAAALGAAVVLVARDAGRLDQVAAEITLGGGKASVFAVDVGEDGAAERIAAHAVETFGHFDTWVNNAGVGLYASLLDTPITDHFKLFQTNYFGLVQGSLAAVRHFQSRAGAGALINVGSIQSDMASPLLGAYNASKHAVKGFTDSLRIELLRAKSPVSVTLIKPAAIGTPFPQHGRNLTGFKARLPQPLYGPNVVADAILHAAQTPRRAITVGFAGRAQVLAAVAFPSLFDRLAGLTVPGIIDETQSVDRVEGNLDRPQPDVASGVEGEQKGRPFSLYTTAQIHPRLATAGVLLGGLALAGWLASRPVAAAAAWCDRRGDPG